MNSSPGASGEGGPARPLTPVFICQAVDRDDPVLATTLRWIEALARQPSVGRVTVLALRTGRHDLPEAVEVRGFGRSNKLATLAGFYREVSRLLRPRPDFFFVYQGGPYPLLLLPFKLLRRIPIVQWKTHPVIGRAMAFYARWCDDLIFTAARASFPLDLPKVRVVGHGIDTELFRRHERTLLGDLIATGRITPRKRIEQMVEAVAHANRTYRTRYRLNVYGATVPGDEAYAAGLDELIGRLGARDWIELHGPVRQRSLPAILSGHRASLNFSETGIDKSVLEAMACGLPVISTNDSATEVMPAELRPILVPDKHSTEQQARAIHELLQRPEADLARLGEQLRAFVESDHSVDLLFDRMLREIEALPAVRA
jgi:glycosyltransferase involved in cell wall biosynthesis